MNSTVPLNINNTESQPTPPPNSPFPSNSPILERSDIQSPDPNTTPPPSAIPQSPETTTSSPNSNNNPAPPMPISPLTTNNASSFALPPLPSSKSKKNLYISLIIGAIIVTLLITTTTYLKNHILTTKTNSPTEGDAYDKSLAKLKTQKQISDDNENTIDNTSTTKSQSRTTIHPETLTIFTKEELTQIGVVSLPEGFSIQEEYKGIKLLRSPQKQYTPTQLKNLKQFIDKTPPALLNPGPSAIVTFDHTEVETGIGLSIGRIAFASGNYMFFDSNSFSGGSGGNLFGSTSLDDTFQTFEHELVHTMQFNQIINQLAQADLVPKNGRYITWVEYSLNSDFIQNFASIADWKKEEIYGKPKYVLTNPNSQSTQYGKTEIIEDMAETISMVILGRQASLSQARQQWAYQQLNMNPSDFEKALLPFFEGFQYAGAPGAPYNRTVFETYENKYVLADKQFFWLEVPNSFTNTAQRYEAELNQRGWTGQLTSKVDENQVNIMSGEFIGPDRDLFVEISGYDNAMNYREKPIGTSIIIFSGYKQ